jgi:hypothetical protein
MGRLYRGPAEYELVAQFAKITLSANSATLITHTLYLLSICPRNNLGHWPDATHFGPLRRDGIKGNQKLDHRQVCRCDDQTLQPADGVRAPGG